MRWRRRATSRTANTVCIVLFTIALSALRTAAAQDTPPSAWARASDISGATFSGNAPWLGAWSPLRSIADLPRGLLRAPLAPGLLDAPAPMAGAFVLTGAPAALARDLVPRLRGDTARFGELRVRTAAERGDFRRPLDDTESQVSSVSGFGWSPVGARGIAIGRFVVDQERNDVSSYGERVSPYVSSPFIATDSVRPPMRRTRARLEGALGLRLGDFGVGFSAGLDAREHNSVDFPLRRTGRAVTPGVSFGVERVLPWYGLRVGGFFRWSEPNETDLLNAAPSPTTTYALQGYDEPYGVATGSTNPVFVRIDRRATAMGGSVEFTAFGARVAVVHERGHHADDQYRNISIPVRPTDQWRASGTETRMMAQRVVGTRFRATLVASRQALDGTGVRSDLRGVALAGREERTAVEGDLRMQFTPRWSGALAGGATHFIAHRSDYVASLASSVDAPVPFASGEVARVFGRATVAVGASAARTSPSGAVPGAAREPNYQRFIAPALAYEVAEARAVAEWLSATMSLRTGTLTLQLRSERTAPSTVVAKRLQPGGDRRGWNVELGWRP